MTIKHDCNKNGCYKEAHLPDWGFLDDHLPGRVRVSDIDGVVELSGHVLFLEWKQHTEKLTVGQRILFERLSSKPQQSVLVIYGEKGNPSRAQIFSGGKVVYDHAVDEETVQHIVSKWSGSTGRLVA